MLLEKSRAITPERIRDRTKAKTTPSCAVVGVTGDGRIWTKKE